MKQMKSLSTVIEVLGACGVVWGVALFSERLAVICGGIFLTLFGLALERGQDAQ